MSNAKHTPGPWVFARDFDEAGQRAKVTTVAVCAEFVIGLPSDFPGGNYRDGDPSGESEADARLIAAAPELLEALTDVSNQARHSDYDWPVELSRAVSAAIAKATGEQPK